MVSAKQRIIQLGHDLGIDPYDVKVRGPIAWAELFGHGVPGIGVCEILSPDCACRADCEDLGSAMHDLKNFELGKHIFSPKILRQVAKRYQKAAEGGCPGGVCN